jgi:hypothetical protein
MPRHIGHCPLCLEVKPRNDEDVLPQWVRSEALRLHPPTTLQAFPPRLKLRICTACNRDMARRYETNAAPLMKPMMRGNQQHLNSTQQRTIALWTIKTMLMLGIADRVKRRLVNEAWRQLLLRLTRDDLPPSGASVRVGIWRHEDLDAESPSVRDLVGDGPPANLQFFAVTTLSRLVLEVLVMSAADDMLAFAAHTPDSEWLRRILPINALGASYPPPRGLTAASIAALRTMYRDAIPAGGYLRHAAGPDWFIQAQPQDG